MTLCCTVVFNFLRGRIDLFQYTDLKIDWIWHLLLKIEAGVIGPTLLYFSIQNHIFRVFIPFKPLK